MPALSPVRSSWPLLPGLQLKSRGKVRDTYYLGNGLLLVVVTDGISIFDFVLNALVPMKGYVLNCLSHFWFQELARDIPDLETHFVAAGWAIDDYLPAELRGNVDLQSRAMVVQELPVDEYEFVFRRVLTGSGLKSYQADGTVCGHRLPEGLHDGSWLEEVLDTPTTKSQDGHDLALDAAEIRFRCPHQNALGRNVFIWANALAARRGILIADTKFEFSHETLVDEILTPDSSRFLLLRKWAALQKSAKPSLPPTLDKQRVREWGKLVGIDRRDPLTPEDISAVHSLAVPETVVSDTSRTYRYIFWLLTGRTVDQYRREDLGINLPPSQPRQVTLIVGSVSDLEEVRQAFPEKPDANLRVHVISCHRNPEVLTQYVSAGCGNSDVIIAAGGKALALPGIVDAFASCAGLELPVIGVALGRPDTEAFEAARLSIKQLPGEPVVLNEVTGEPYQGIEGLRQAYQHARDGEFPPRLSERKPAQFDVPVWN